MERGGKETLLTKALTKQSQDSGYELAEIIINQITQYLKKQKARIYRAFYWHITQVVPVSQSHPSDRYRLREPLNALLQ